MLTFKEFTHTDEAVTMATRMKMKQAARKNKAKHIKLNEVGLLKHFFGKHIYQDGTLDKEEWWIDGERCCSVGMSYPLNQKEKNFLESKGV